MRKSPSRTDLKGSPPMAAGRRVAMETLQPSILEKEKITGGIMPLRFDLSKCTGCKLCQLACSASHYGVFNPEKARLRIIHEYNDEGIKIASKNCIFCKKCEKVCPEQAISNNGKWMIVDPEKCTGCGTCVANCPTKIIFLNQKKSVICDLCEGEPECVSWCPKGVISLKTKKGAAV